MLQQQTFLQISGADAGRVKLLQHREHPPDFFLRGREAVVDFQLVGNLAERLGDEAVVVERTDEVFQDVALVVAQVVFAHLLREAVIEGECLAPFAHLIGQRTAAGASAGVALLQPGILHALRLHALPQFVERERRQPGGQELLRGELQALLLRQGLGLCL